MQASPQTPSAGAPSAPQAARSAPTATEMYDAAKLVQRELIDQRDQLVRTRRNLAEELRNASNPVVAKGIENRVVAIDARIADVEKQLAAAETQLAQSASIPGVVVQPPSRGDGVPPEAFVLGGLGMVMLLLLPVSIAWARRIWRRGAPQAPAHLPAELGERMLNIERAVEAVAIEVERMGEGQRFVVQLLDAQSKRALGAAARLDRESS